jgi:hypothetical protein
VSRELDATAVGYKANEGYKSIHTSAVEKQASGQSTENEQFFADIVRWLASQSYLLFDKEDGYKFSGAVVTEKGLKLCETLSNS